MMREGCAFEGCKLYFAESPDFKVAFDFEVSRLAAIAPTFGAEVAATPEEATHCIVWHLQQPDVPHFQHLASRSGGPAICSLLWFLACVDDNSLLHTKHPLYHPFPAAAIPRGSARQLRVSVTGFAGRQRLMVQTLLTCMGVSFQRQLHVAEHERDDVLVAVDLTDMTSKKLDAAK